MAQYKEVLFVPPTEPLFDVTEQLDRMCTRCSQPICQDALNEFQAKSDIKLPYADSVLGIRNLMSVFLDIETHLCSEHIDLNDELVLNALEYLLRLTNYFIFFPSVEITQGNDVVKASDLVWDMAELLAVIVRMSDSAIPREQKQPSSSDTSMIYIDLICGNAYKWSQLLAQNKLDVDYAYALSLAMMQQLAAFLGTQKRNAGYDMPTYAESINFMLTDSCYVYLTELLQQMGVAKLPSRKEITVCLVDFYNK